MGADLYINSLVKKARDQYDPLFNAAVRERNEISQAGERSPAILGSVKYTTAYTKAQEKVEKYYNLANGEGYFRDSYNNSSLFWILGLSWWELAQQGVIDDKGYISPENAYLLAQLVKELPYVKPITADLFSDTETVEQVQEYFDTKRKDFIAFLMLSYNMNEAVYASV
jgi:hypothetical protein